MGWQDLLAPAEGEIYVLPWAGGKEVHSLDRTWTIQGRRPPEHGWWSWQTKGGRKISLKDKDPAPIEPFFCGEKPRAEIRGYLVGDRFIEDSAPVDPDPAKLIDQTEPVFCVERGLDRFTRATVYRDRERRLIFLRQEWPEGPEAEVLMAYQDRLESVDHVSGVTPALDLAFQWISRQRILAEERAVEMERLLAEERTKMEAEERLRQAMKDAGTGAGRRALAAKDFGAAARAALAISGAELLDFRDSYQKGQKVVQYRFRQRRLECVVDAVTLRIVDAGVCLDDHRGTKGDTFFTLESLPGVIGEAMDLHKLVVWRHVGDEPEPEEERDFEWEDRWD